MKTLNFLCKQNFKKHIMKKLFVTAFAFASIIACNKVEQIGPKANPEIAFGDSFVEIKTRADEGTPAEEDYLLTTANINAFDVWAFMDDTDAMVLNEKRVTKTEEGWEYENLQYWLGGHTYYFGAIAPVDKDNISINTSGANTYGLGEITFTNLDGKDDLVYASKAVKTEEDIINNDPGKVSLQFAHLLSKVKFTFTNGFTTDNTKITIKNLKMNAPKAGTLNLAQQDWWSNNAWVVTEEGLTLDFGDVNGGEKMGPVVTADCAHELLTIPDDATRTYTITFDVALYMGTYETPAYSVTRTVKLTDQELKIGKNYNFKATIGPENIHPDGPLQPIEFDIIEVNGWEEGVVNPLPLAK